MTEFINGVEYLYTIPAEEPISYWILLAVFFVAFAVFGVFSLMSAYPDGAEAVFWTAVIAGIATLLGFIAIKNHNTDNLRPEQYAVTISDEVSLKEFAESYTIVEQKGNVYIIEVKDNEHD